MAKWNLTGAYFKLMLNLTTWSWVIVQIKFYKKPIPNLGIGFLWNVIEFILAWSWSKLSLFQVHQTLYIFPVYSSQESGMWCIFCRDGHPLVWFLFHRSIHVYWRWGRWVYSNQRWGVLNLFFVQHICRLSAPGPIFSEFSYWSTKKVVHQLISEGIIYKE